MKTTFSSGKNTILMLLITSAVLLVGCSGDKKVKLGQAIPANSEVIKLRDIAAAPLEYNGKTVVLKGVISGQCPSLCEFFFKEGAHQVTVYPQGYKFPKLPQGKQVTVLASITSGNENIVFSALGIEL